MAIKGKSKTRSRRAVAGGPKPTYVVPKRPFLARRWVKLTALVAVLGVIAGGLVYGFLKQRANDRLERERTVVRSFSARIEGPLQPVATVLPPTGLQVFGEIRQNVEQLRQEQIDPSDVVENADFFERVATRAEETIGDIEASRLVREEDLPLDLIDAQQFFLQAVRTYGEAARTLRMAAEAAPGERRDALLDVTDQLLRTADELFGFGYNKLNTERARLGILQPRPFAGEGAPASG